MPKETLHIPIWLANGHLDAFGRLVEAPSLAFRLTPYDGSLTRFSKKLVGVPDIDLSRYTFRACVESVDLSVRLRRATQCRHVAEPLQRVLGRIPYVTDQLGRTGAGAGNGFEFVIRVQQPDRACLNKLVRTLDLAWGLSSPIVLENIAIAIDIYPNGGDDPSRWMMTSMLAKTFLPSQDLFPGGLHHGRYFSDDLAEPKPLVGSSHRRTLPSLLGMPSDTCRSAHVAAPGDGIVHFGSNDSGTMLRIHEKIGDRRYPSRGVLELLEQRDRRSRIEVRLGAKKLKTLELDSLDHLFRFRFESLRTEAFTFWLPTFEVPWKGDDERQAIFQRTGVYGLERHDLGMQRWLAQPSGELRTLAPIRNLIPFSQLNERMRRALRGLSEKWEKEKPWESKAA